MKKLKISDEVIVIAGKDKGKKGKIKSINLKSNRVLVEGVNVMKKTLKPTQENPNGGFVDLEKSVHISNISLLSPKDGKATRVGFVEKDGKQVRVSKRCGTVI